MSLSVPPHHPSACPPCPCDHLCLPSTLLSVTPQPVICFRSHIVYPPIYDTPITMPRRLAPHVPTLPRLAFIYTAPGPCAGFVHASPALIHLHLCLRFGSHAFWLPAVPLSHGRLPAPPCSFPPCLAGVLVHRRHSCPASPSPCPPHSPVLSRPSSRHPTPASSVLAHGPTGSGRARYVSMRTSVSTMPTSHARPTGQLGHI